MTKEKMTIHQALCELKILDSRIEDASCEDMIAANRNNNLKIDGKTIEETKTIFKANFDKLWSLIDRRNAMKLALTQSNAETVITVAGKKMTVAKAIDENKNGIGLYKRVLKTLRCAYADAQKAVIQGNGTSLDEKVERYLASTFGSCEKGVKTDDMIKAEEIYRKNNSYDLIDPNDLKKQLDEKEEELNALIAELDSAIQVSNATTYIEFEY